MLKTPALAEAHKPLGRLEAIAKEEYDAAMQTYLLDAAMYKAEQHALKGQMVKSARARFKGCDPESARAQFKVYVPKDDPRPDLKSMLADLKTPDPPIWRRYKTNDATIEKISELLAVNPRGLLIFRDELIGLLTSWDKEGENRIAPSISKLGTGTVVTPLTESGEERFIRSIYARASSAGSNLPS
jgi:hypothetical protein